MREVNNDYELGIVEKIVNKNIHVTKTWIPEGPLFFYTVGLQEVHNHPEIIMFGVPEAAAISFLINFIHKISEGEIIETGKRYFSGNEGDVQLQFISVEKRGREEYMLSAVWYYEGCDNFHAMQLVWPDEQGYFPWEESFDEKFEEHQPLLGKVQA